MGKPSTNRGNWLELVAICALLVVIVVALAISSGAISLSRQAPSASLTSPAEENVSAPTTPPVPSSTPAAEPSGNPSTLTIVSTGDILPHLSVNHFARQADGTLDYARLWDPVAPYIQNADLALCALEVPIVPPGEKPSNYPMFGAPPELVSSLQKFGFDGCALATNHSMDRGFAGIKSTIDNLAGADLGWAGTARSEQEAQEIQFYTLRAGNRDVKIAHLSATMLTNGMPYPREGSWAWNVVGELGERSVDDIIDEARRARALGADLVVLNMHWGVEYVSQPPEDVVGVAQQLADSGEIDAVFGGHSHVPQPVAKLEGGPDGNGMWVAYSAGNFISGQTVENHGCRVVAGVVNTATVEVPAEGPARVTKMDWTAVTQDTSTYHIWPLHLLREGQRPAGLAMGEDAINCRIDATYPVMETEGSTEKVEPPARVADSVSLTRE